MMEKLIICIQCPKGCNVKITFSKKAIIKIEGNTCEKGELYVKQELENPVRTITSTVLTKGLELKMLPVKTSSSIPKAKIMEIMKEIRKTLVKKPVKTGDVIIKNILGLGIDLVSTRDLGP